MTLSDPAWLTIAKGEFGTKEIKGDADNPRIVEYHATTTMKATDDETPWCSAFVNWCMKQAGIKGTNLANARSWLNWGKELDFPEKGCVVILKRGNPPAGHVCFFIQHFSQDVIVCLGGNQADQVKYSQYNKADVLGYRWPSSQA